MLFLPQRPYMPIGPLREAIWFPEAAQIERDEDVLAALAAVGLSGMGTRLDETAHWAQILSPGEQQRIAIARALLLKPDWLFLDEVTAAHDEREEAELYRRLAAALPDTTIVSIGQRRSLEAFHDRTIILGSLGRSTADCSAAPKIAVGMLDPALQLRRSRPGAKNSASEAGRAPALPQGPYPR